MLWLVVLKATSNEPLIKLFNQTRNQTNVPNPFRHHRGENNWALGRSAKATRLLGQLGTFTGNHESITILLNHISLLPKGKLWRAQQASFLLASGIKPKLWGEEQLRPCRTGGLHTGAAVLMKWAGRTPRLLDELFKTLPFESYSPDSISNEAPLLFLYRRIGLFLINHLWFIRSGLFSWNSSMFAFPVALFMANVFLWSHTLFPRPCK